jgi:hypothetical protein
LSHLNYDLEDPFTILLNRIWVNHCHVLSGPAVFDIAVPTSKFLIRMPIVHGALSLVLVTGYPYSFSASLKLSNVFFKFQRYLHVILTGLAH